MFFILTGTKVEKNSCVLHTLQSPVWSCASRVPALQRPTRLPTKNSSKSARKSCASFLRLLRASRSPKTSSRYQNSSGDACIACCENERVKKKIAKSSLPQARGHEFALVCWICLEDCKLDVAYGFEKEAQAPNCYTGIVQAAERSIAGLCASQGMSDQLQCNLASNVQKKFQMTRCALRTQFSMPWNKKV